MNLFALVFLSFIFSLNLSSRTNEFYNETRLGERDAGLYFGPLSPEMYFESTSATLRFFDERYFEEDYIATMVAPEINRLSHFSLLELPEASACPPSQLNKSILYIRYLYRLITLSYLFESERFLGRTLYDLSLDRQNCSLSFNNLFGRCRPKTEDMKKFLSRVKQLDFSKYNQFIEPPLNKKNEAAFYEELKTNKGESSYLGSRLIRAVGTSDVTSLDLENGIKKSCTEDRKLIDQICSEEDLLFGLSSVSLAEELIASSHAIKVINESGTALGCLKRYPRLLARKEQTSSLLIHLFPKLFEHLKKRDATYLQGDLFLPGALKEFDDLGMNDFLFGTPTPIPTPIVAETRAPLPQPVITPVVSVATSQPPLLPLPIVTAAPTPPPEIIKLTAVMEAEAQIQSGALSAWVDMRRFANDYPETKEKMKKLEEKLVEFQTREALLDMKQFDKLGSKTEPVRLLFLKFLIDRNKHQGLYNLISVLGSKFYMVNDLEGSKKESFYIELENSFKTKFRWQIKVLKD